MYGIILAGGKGTRLAVAYGHGSKALVPVGHVPHLVRQVQWMRKEGVSNIVVVTSSRNVHDVETLIKRANLENVYTVIQNEDNVPGPVTALYTGMGYIERSWESNASAIVLMADSFINEPLSPAMFESPLGYGWAEAPSSRDWAFFCDERGEFVDGFARMGDPVTIGVYTIKNVTDALNEIRHEGILDNPQGLSEIPMSHFLNLYQFEHSFQHFETWRDLGDIEALRNAVSTVFIAREHNSLRIEDRKVYKSGPKIFNQYAIMKAHEDSGVFPTVKMTDNGELEMDLIDHPTLAELWLYRDGRSESWEYIMYDILTTLESSLWKGRRVRQGGASDFFLKKAVERLNLVDGDEANYLRYFFKSLTAQQLLFGPQLDSWVYGHGDLNWNNIFYSPSTGKIQLVDPRGDTLVPHLYELVKLRYSYRSGFAEITHGVTLDRSARREEIEAMDVVLKSEYSYTENSDMMDVAEAAVIAAAVPLHAQEEGERMLKTAIKLVERF